MLFPEEEKIIVEEIRSNGQTVVEERSSRAFYSHTLNKNKQPNHHSHRRCSAAPCRSLVDTVYCLKDEVQELKQVSR